MSRRRSDQLAAPDAVPNAASGQRHALPYGQACTGCAKAKCRCKPSASSREAKCERCLRLRRACEPSQATRKRGGGRPRHRTAQIEEKLETLVNILTSQSQHPVAPINSAYPLSSPASVTIGVPSSQDPSLSNGQRDDCGADTSPSIVLGNTPSFNIPHPLFEGVDQSQAEENLRLFRTTYLPAFPAVHIPVTTASAQLQSQRPYLWLAIQSLCCRPFSTRAALQEKVRRRFAERAAVQYECSLDLLLGHLVLAMWGPLTFCSINAFYMSAAMATMMAQNLKLDTDPNLEAPGFRSIAYGSHPALAPKRFSNGQQPVQSKRTDEERRAILACFCLSSNTYHKLGMPPMRWTPHLDECLRHLADHPNCENDEILVIQTKCSRILNDVCSSSPYAFRSSVEGGDRVHDRLSSMILTKALKGHLQEVRSHIRPPILEQRIVKFWLLITEVMIIDLELQNPSPSTPSASLNFARAQSLQSCLSAIIHFLGTFFSFKPHEHGGLHFHYGLNYLRCLQIVYRLLLTEDSAWDRSEIRESVDLMGSLQRGAEICRAIPVDAGLDTNGKDGYTIFATNLQRISVIWTEALEQAGVVLAGNPTMTDAQPPSIFQEYGVGDLNIFDLFGDAWMADVVA